MSVIPALNERTPRLLRPLPPGVAELPRKTPRPEIMPPARFESVLEYSTVPPASSMVPRFVVPTVSMMMWSPDSARIVPPLPLLRPAVKRPVPRT